MKPESATLHTVRQWIQKAENDLKSAANNLRSGRDAPADAICFSAQQCVEKCMKALMVYRGIDFPKTHDLEALVRLLPTRLRPRLTVEEQRRLTRYATLTRYPGDYEPVTLAEARRAVGVARRVRAAIRKHVS